MKRFPTGPLRDIDNRIHRSFKDLAATWRETQSVWKDDRARRFESERLSALPPTLTQLATELAELIEQIESANRELDDD